MIWAYVDGMVRVLTGIQSKEASARMVKDVLNELPKIVPSIIGTDIQFVVSEIVGGKCFRKDCEKIACISGCKTIGNDGEVRKLDHSQAYIIFNISASGESVKSIKNSVNAYLNELSKRLPVLGILLRIHDDCGDEIILDDLSSLQNSMDYA